MKKAEDLFAAWEAPMVRACLQGEMGRIQAVGESSAMACIGDFCFLVGDPVPELVERADAPILVPGSEDWSRLIIEKLGGGAVPFTRYAVRCAPEYFDRGRLISFTSTLPKGFSIHPIGRESYFTLMGQEWSRDLCGNFKDADDFLIRGVGFVIIQGGNLPVAGAASYAACRGAIEIEIDTRPDFRRLGLAKACGARLILECLERGLYPGWDAHDGRSLALAEQLGYRLERPYLAYWVEKKVRYRKDLRIN